MNLKTVRDGAELLLWNAIYNHARDPDRGILPWTGTLNTLSTLRGALRGRVEHILPPETEKYKKTLSLMRAHPGIEIPAYLWLYIISQVIERLPGYIEWLNIPIAERAQLELQKYYMYVGEKLKQQGTVKSAV
jgi:hypothetical protein